MANPNLTIIPRVAKLSPRVISVLGCNPGPMTLRGTNTYIIGTGKRRVLFDTADGNQPEYFLNLKKSLNFDKLTIQDIILSHWHPDHVGGLKDILQFAEKSCRVFKFKRSDGEEPKLPPNVNYTWIEDGQQFEVDGVKLKAFHTPGHTSDSIILHLEEENAVFSADTMLGEGTAVFEDLHDYIKSLEKILALNPSVIYPGHGPVIRDPKERIEFYIQHRKQREEQILRALQEKQGLKMAPMDIVKIIYTDTPENLHEAAAKNVKQHLAKLLKEGKVQEDNETFFI